MTGINYITNDKGQKTDLIISLKQHGQLVEDILDTLLVEERSSEETVSWENLLSDLKSRSEL